MLRSNKAFQNVIRLVIEFHGKIENNKICFYLARIKHVNIRINYVNIMLKYYF